MKNQVKEIGNIVGNVNNWQSLQRGRVYSFDGASPCLNTCGGGNLEPKILVYEEQKEWGDL